MNYCKNNKKTKIKQILINNLLFLFLISILLIFVKNTLANTGSIELGIVDTQKILSLFPEVKQKIYEIENRIEQKNKELKNLPKTMELKFISEMEIHMKKLSKKREEFEKEIQQKIIYSQDVNNEIKAKIENLKKQVEKQIGEKKKMTEQKIKIIEKEIYKIMNKDLQNIKEQYYKKLELEIDKQIAKSKKEIEEHKNQIQEIYKNEIVNLNLKISNSSIYDKDREKIMEKLQIIKQKQENLIKEKVEQTQKEVYKKIEEIQKIYEEEYKIKSKEIIQDYETNYKQQVMQITKEYNDFVSKLEQEYNKTVLSFLKNTDNKVNQEIYNQYIQKISTLQEEFEKIKKNLAEKYDKLMFDKFNKLNEEIQDLEKQKDDLIYQFESNISNIIKQVAEEKKLKYVFSKNIVNCKVIDITDDCMKKIKEIKNKSK